MLVDQDSVAVAGFMCCRAIPTGKVYESDFVHLVTKSQEFFDTYTPAEALR